MRTVTTGRTSGLIIIFLILVSTVAFFSSPSLALPQKGEDFLPIEKIEKGMEGVGKTVVKGHKISEFKVEITGILDKPGVLEDLIIVRCSGPAIEKSGGVAQGMSGSPVYVDGKLIGALSRAALWTRTPDRPIGLITPIDLMLKLMEGKTAPGAFSQAEEKSINQNLNGSIKRGLDKALPGSQRIKLSSQPPSSEELEKGKDTVFAYPLNTPLMVEGLGNHAYSNLIEGIDLSEQDYVFQPSEINAFGSSGESHLSSDLSDLGFNVHNAGSGSYSQGKAMELQAGGPVGVALTTGDVSVGSLGTVTYKEGDSVLAFGHRFLMGGSTDYALTRTEIFDTVQGLKSSWKLGTLGRKEGSIVQDRMQGILGRIGEKPDFLNLSVDVSRKDKNALNSMQVELTKENKLVARLLYPVLMESIDRSINRIGEGTAKISYTISGKNMPQKLERTDIFFSTTDVARLPSLQLAAIVDYLAFNPFKSPGFTQIEAEVEVMSRIRAGIISYFATNKNVFSPGDSIIYKIKVKNYRDEMTEKTGLLKIPENTKPGDYILAVYGGPRPQAVAPPQDILSFEQSIKYLQNMKNYEHLSVELLRPLSEKVVPMSASGYRYTSTKRVYHKYEDRFILGRKGISIKIREESKQGTEGEEK